MTSPDNRPGSAYQGPQAVGDWDLDELVKGIGGVLGTFERILGVLTGAAGGLDQGWAELAGLVGMRWDQANRHETEILDLQDTTTDLSLSRGHATAYMTASPGTTTVSTLMPFTAQSGTRRGVTPLGDGRWRLDSAGEWDLSAQVEFWGGVLMPPGTYMEILVRDPQGGVFDGVTAIGDSSNRITVTNVTSTQVPAPGYTIEVRAWTDDIPIIGGTFRGIRGGYSTTRLRIRKFELLKEEAA